MKRVILAALPLIAASPGPSAELSGPGSSITDAAGNVWTITASGSVMEGDQYTPGGGGTSALTIIDGVIYGQDARTKAWFTLSGGQYWTPSAAPSAADVTPSTPAATVSAPSITQASVSLAACAGTSTSQFGILPTQQGGVGEIIDAQGNKVVLRGIGIMEGQEPSVQTLQANFPGINFVRYAIYDYPEPAKIAPWVNSLTAAGIVVEIENHSNGAGNAGGAQGAVFTGQQLANESRWYAAQASYFKGNARVWFGTNNEPPGPGGALSQWHLATYNAIRGTGNNTPILIDPVGAYLTDDLDSSVYAQMTNVAWDVHFYGWGANYSTDAGTVKSTLAGFIKNAQAQKSAGGVTMPVIIGEYGDSTDGYKIDPNGMVVVQVVHDAVASGMAAGSAAWVWAPPMPGDGLVQNVAGGVTSPYGSTVAAYLRSPAPGGSVCQGTTGGSQSGSIGASISVASSAPAQPGDGLPSAHPSDPTVSPTYTQAAQEAASAVEQATAAAVAAGQARMSGN